MGTYVGGVEAFHVFPVLGVQEGADAAGLAASSASSCEGGVHREAGQEAGAFGQASGVFVVAVDGVSSSG